MHLALSRCSAQSKCRLNSVQTNESMWSNRKKGKARPIRKQNRNSLRIYQVLYFECVHGQFLSANQKAAWIRANQRELVAKQSFSVCTNQNLPNLTSSRSETGGQCSRPIGMQLEFCGNQWETITWLVGLERAKIMGASLMVAISRIISGVKTYKTIGFCLKILKILFFSSNTIMLCITDPILTKYKHKVVVLFCCYRNMNTRKIYN